MNTLVLTRLRIATSVHLQSSFKPLPNSAIFIPPKLPPSLSLSSFSSHSSSSSLPPPPLESTNQDSSSIDDVSADVTTEELKNRIDRYEKGDMEALPLIFEAILARKLSGNHEDTDDELMEEFRSNTQQDEDQDFQSDEDSDEDQDLTDSDEDFSD